MVILSAAITTKSGKSLLSRQYVEMTRVRIEGLLAAFPKLMGSDGKQQHTFIETDAVRYVYQPMEQMYLLLITNRASNIVEDLETLRLLSKVVPSITDSSNNLSEERVLDKCFELIFAFDEVITAGGYREPINLQQIATNMAMESHEEKLHNMIKVSKMESAKEHARDAAKVIREKQREQIKLNQSMGMSNDGMGSDGGMRGGGGGGGGGGGFNASSPFDEPPPPVAAPATVPSQSRAAPVKGMSLGGGNKNKSLEDALAKEDKLAPINTVSSKAALAAAAAHPEQPVVQVVQHPVMIAMSERVTCKMTSDGAIESFDIKGSLALTVTTEEAAQWNIQLNQGAGQLFKFQTHPNVNKPVYEKSGLLQMKDSSKSFTLARPVGILKWSYTTASNEEMIPIKINCWPEEEAKGMMNVSIEYSMDLTDVVLHGVRIVVPLGTSDAPRISNVDGTHKHNASAGELTWDIDVIDTSNPTGSLEFTILQKDTDAFFPINVSFASQNLFCKIDVASVKNADGSPIQYGLSRGIVVDEYVIG